MLSCCRVKMKFSKNHFHVMLGIVVLRIMPISVAEKRCTTHNMHTKISAVFILMQCADKIFKKALAFART